MYFTIYPSNTCFLVSVATEPYRDCSALPSSVLIESQKHYNFDPICIVNPPLHLFSKVKAYICMIIWSNPYFCYNIVMLKLICDFGGWFYLYFNKLCLCSMNCSRGVYFPMCMCADIWTMKTYFKTRYLISSSSMINTITFYLFFNCGTFPFFLIITFRLRWLLHIWQL